MFTPTEIERYREIVEKYTQGEPRPLAKRPVCINNDCILNQQGTQSPQQGGFGGGAAPPWYVYL